MDPVAQQHEHRIQQQQQQQQQLQQHYQEQELMPPVSSSLQSLPLSLPPPPSRSSSVGSNSVIHNETSEHHSSFHLHRDHHKNESIAMNSSDFKGGGDQLREIGIIVNNTRVQGMNCDSNEMNNHEGNNKLDHNNTQRTDDHHDNKNSSSNNNKSDILLYSNDYNNSSSSSSISNSNNLNSNNGSINCDHIETTKLSIDLDKTITKSIILRQNSSNGSDNNNHHNEIKSKIQHSNTMSENHMSYQQQQAAYHHYHHQQQQQHYQQQQHHHHLQQQQQPINSLYVNNPDFSKTIPTSSASSSPSLVKMKPPDFSKLIVNNNNKSNDLQIANPDFSKIGSTSSSPGAYKPDRPVVNQTNFAEISKKYNYISDLQLKKPIDTRHSPLGGTPNQGPPYPNLYVKAPDFSAPKIQNKFYPEQQQTHQQQQNIVQKPASQSQPPTSSSSQYDCEPTAHVIHKYPYINSVSQRAIPQPQRTNPQPQNSGRDYLTSMSPQQYEREQINRMDHERKQQEEDYYRKHYAHYYSKSPQQLPVKQQQQPTPSAPPERYYQQDYKSAHAAQQTYNQQKYYGHSQYPQPQPQSQPQPQPQSNVIPSNIANQYSKSGQPQQSPYLHHSSQVQNKSQSTGLMNPPQNWPNSSISKVDTSRSPIIHQPSPTHHHNIPSPVNSYKSTSPHSNVPSPKMSNSPFAGYSASPNTSNASGITVPTKYDNYPPPQLKQHQVDYVDLTAARKKSETNLKCHPKFASTGTLNANHSNHNMDETNLTRAVDSGRYGQHTAYPETRHSSVDINFYNKALHPDVSIRVSDEKMNSYHHQYPQGSSALRSSSIDANLNKVYYQSGHSSHQRVGSQIHSSQSIKYPPKLTGHVAPQSQMMVHDNYSRPSAVVSQVPPPIDPFIKGSGYRPQAQQPAPPVKIDRPRPSETVTSRSGMKYSEMYPTNPSMIQQHQSQTSAQQLQPQVAPPAPPPPQTKSMSSSVVSSTTKKDLSSPLDLSVKTIKTKADSTGDDLKIMPSNSALKVDFHPNFSKHGIGAYHQDQSRSSSSSSSSTSRVVVGPQPTPNISTFFDKKSDLYLTNTPQHISKAVESPYNNVASASSSTARPVVDQSNYVSKKSLAKSYSSQANNSGPQPQYPPPVPEKKYPVTQPPVIVTNRLDKTSLQYQQDRKLVENILKRNISINPFSYSGTFNHTSKSTAVDPKSPPNEKSGIYSTTTSSQTHRKRAAEPLPHEASLPPVKHSRSDHPQKTVTEVYENMLESMNKNKENPYQRNHYQAPNNYQPTQPHPQHLAPQQPQASSNRYQYPYPTKEGNSSGSKQSHQIYYQTSSEYQNLQPKNYPATPQETPMRTKEPAYQYPVYQQQQPDYYPNHHPPNHKIVEPIPQAPPSHTTDYYNHPPQHQISPTVQPHHPQPITTLSHTQSTNSFQVIHPTNHNRDVIPEIHHNTHPPIVPYAHPVGYHRQQTDQAIRTLESNLKIIENHSAPINGNNNPVLLPSPKGADQTVISKLRTSLEMKEIEKQKLLRKSSLEMIAPITKNHVITTAIPAQQTAPLIAADRAETENLETESTNDSRRSNEMNSILAARIRTKGELKGFIPIPAIQPPVAPQLNTVITRNCDFDLDNHNSRLSNKTLEPTSDMEGVAKFDLMDWDKACNEFVAELQTNEIRAKKPVRKRKPKPKPVSPKLETVQKEFELVETSSNIVDIEIENQVDIVKSENKDFSSFVAKISDKSSSSSDEDKPLYFLKQSQESSNTIKKETTMNDDDSQSSVNKSKRSSLNDRSSKEKQRLERERRLAARLGSSSSDSETDAQKIRVRKRIRKPKSRMSIAMKSRTSVESSEDDKPIKPKIEPAQSQSSEIPLETKLESSDSEPISAPRKKSLRIVSENDDAEMAEVVIKKDETEVNPIPVTPIPEPTPVPKEPESKRIMTTRISRSSTRNSISNQEEETPKKEIDDPEKALVTPKSKALPKKASTSGTKITTKPSPVVVITRITETPSPPEETMTRSKRKREIEQQLSNSKVLRNDKVVKNIQFEAKAKANKLTQMDNKIPKNSIPVQSMNITPANSKTKKIEESKRKTMESEGELEVVKSNAKNKRPRRGSKAQKSCSTSSSERASSSSSSEASENENEHGVAERLRPRKAKTNSVGEEKSKPAGQTKSSPGTDTKGKSVAKEDKSVINSKTSKASPIKKGQADPKAESSPLPPIDATKHGVIEDSNHKFHPGWEEEFYQYKRALKVPPSLISVRHRISTSLPDLDHSSDASECFSACSGDKTPRPNQKQTVEAQTTGGTRLTTRKTVSLNPTPAATPAPTPPPIIKTEFLDAPLKSKSIIELLHQRVSRPPIKSKKLTKTNQEPKLLPRVTESELLATPGSANENIFGGRKLFETPVLKSRTRTEHRVLKTKEIIREVFGGEDRPASAPPLGQDPTSENESTENMTFDEKYAQYLQKMNVDFIDRINAKARAKQLIVVPTEVAIKQECDESTMLVETLIKQEPLEMQEPRTCDTPSVASERNTVTPVLFRTLVKAKKKGNRSARRKGSSGFDYIRKKKKPSSSQNAGTSQADIQSEINKKKKLAAMHEKLMQEKDENDVSREVRGWVLNKGVGESVLHKAARLGYIDAIAYCLIRMDMDPDPKDNAGYTPLHEACSRGHLEIARLLLRYGANPSSTAQSGIRPLHEAIENNYIEIVRLLLSYGADPLLATYSGQTPLMLSESEEMTNFLKSHLYDIQNTSPLKSSWKFNGPWRRYDPDTEGYEVLAGAPAAEQDTLSFEVETPIKLNGIDRIPVIVEPRFEIKSNFSESNMITVGNNGTIVSTSSVIKMNSTVVLPSKLNKNKNCTAILNSLCPEVKNESLLNSSNDNNNNNNNDDNAADNVSKPIDECDNVAILSGDDLFEIEESDNPLPPLYLLKDEGTDKWVLLQDLCNLLKVKSKDSLLKQICPSSPPSTNKELLRELKMSDFLEKATCLQLLCAGEKLNIRASKVVLVRYNDSVRTLLGVKTIMMTM